jgi:hypothetical protein
MTEKDNFSYLTGGLALVMFLAALVDQVGLPLVQLSVQSGIVVVLAIGVWSIHGRRHWRITRLGLLAAIIVVTGASLVLSHMALDLVWLGTLLVYLVMTTWTATRQVLFSGPIDANNIIGAVCIYLLIALIWATLYMMLVVVDPAAFGGLDAEPWFQLFPDMVYLSFITLTTVGYGDILPVEPLARFLAFAEAVVGQFYVAILVASLVGLRLAGNRR